MDLDAYLRFVFALVFVISLIGVLAFAMKRYGPGGRMMRKVGGRRRLSVVEMTPLDGKRRLVLVRRDDREHLLVVGATGETVVERGIPVPDHGEARNGKDNGADRPQPDNAGAPASTPAAPTADTLP